MAENKAMYYKIQLDRLKNQGGAVKFITERITTGYIPINEESIPAMIDYLKHEQNRLKKSKKVS